MAQDIQKKNLAKELYMGSFGKEYTDRSNKADIVLRDEHTVSETGFTISQSLSEALCYASGISNVLEVGAGAGHNLQILSSMGYKNLWGSDIQKYALELGAIKYSNINLIEADSMDLPFESNSFDLVLTRMHLIHFHPDILHHVINEILRVCRKYILGIEYYSKETKEIIWRGQKEVAWKTDFVRCFRTLGDVRCSVVYEAIVPIFASKYGKEGLAYQHFLINKNSKGLVK